MAEEVLATIPMFVNLGGIHTWESLIGQGKVTRDSETGQNKIEITLDKETSAKLGNMVDVFELKAIGFAGIKRRPVEKES